MFKTINVVYLRKVIQPYVSLFSLVYYHFVCRLSFIFIIFALFLYLVNNINMILDAVLLILTLLSLHIIKANYPNFLFLPLGAALFLPPEDTP